jgi:hypothetical protein
MWPQSLKCNPTVAYNFLFLQELKGRCSKAVKAIWKKTIADSLMPKGVFNAAKEIPQDLLKAIQEPLIMRWWTIAVLACKAQRYLPFFINMANGLGT